MKSFVILFLIIATAAKAQIKPGAVWLDNTGKQIQAHGGAIIRYKNLYYWYGETYYKSDSGYKSVNCYSSKDLLHWSPKGYVLTMKNPDSNLSYFKLERPKVFYNAGTKKFVMYMHIDGVAAGFPSDYSYARVGVAISDRPTGPFKFIRSFRPLGCESRDIGQFIDDEGRAYLIFEDRPSGGFHIARLSPDYLNVTADVCLIREPLEGGAIVHYKGLYYVIGSHLTGWNPNPNVYAFARSLKGPWSEFKNIAPTDSNTYNSQSSFLLKIVGSKTTTVVFMGDQWKEHALSDSRYLWMPLIIGDGKLVLPPPKPWTIHVKSGSSN